MPKTQCPHCQATFKLKDDSLIGQVRPCAKCGKKFRVQDADEYADQEIEEPVAPPRSQRKSSQGKKKSGGNGLLMAIGGGVAVVCAVVGVYFAFFRGGSAENVDKSGGEMAGSPAANTAAIDLKKNSEMIAFACHLFKDSSVQFPHPEISPEGKTGLSWRVQCPSAGRPA